MCLENTTRRGFELGLDLESAGERVRVESQHPVDDGLVTRVGGMGVPPVVVGVMVRMRGRRGRRRRRVEGRGLADRPRGENGGGKFKHSTHKLSLSLCTQTR